MLPVQPTKTARKHVALARVFEAFVEAGEPLKRSIGFGVFDASGTLVDRLLAKLPQAAVPAASTAPPACGQGSHECPSASSGAAGRSQRRQQRVK